MESSRWYYYEQQNNGSTIIAAAAAALKQGNLLWNRILSWTMIISERVFDCTIISERLFDCTLAMTMITTKMMAIMRLIMMMPMQQDELKSSCHASRRSNSWTEVFHPYHYKEVRDLNRRRVHFAAVDSNRRCVYSSSGCRFFSRLPWTDHERIMGRYYQTSEYRHAAPWTWCLNLQWWNRQDLCLEKWHASQIIVA